MKIKQTAVKYMCAKSRRWLLLEKTQTYWFYGIIMLIWNHKPTIFVLSLNCLQREIWEKKRSQWEFGTLGKRSKMCSLLPFIHSISGCGTTSYMFGISVYSRFWKKKNHDVQCTLERKMLFKLVKKKYHEFMEMYNMKALICCGTENLLLKLWLRTCMFTFKPYHQLLMLPIYTHCDGHLQIVSLTPKMFTKFSGRV